MIFRLTLWAGTGFMWYIVAHFAPWWNLLLGILACTAWTLFVAFVMVPESHYPDPHDRRYGP